MDNQELEKQIKEILAIKNYFEMIEKVSAFEKDYKTSEFYKKTKKPLEQVLKEARVHYALQLKDLGKYLQDLIDNLSLDNLNSLLDKISSTFQRENNDIASLLETFKEIQ